MSHSQAKSEEPTSTAPIPSRDLLKFLIPSIIGVMLFLVPFQMGDSINIGMGVMADGLQSLLEDALPAIALFVLCLSVVVTLYVKVTQPAWAKSGPFHDMFNVGAIWIAMRVLGAVFVIMTFFQFGRSEERRVGKECER